MLRRCKLARRANVGLHPSNIKKGKKSGGGQTIFVYPHITASDIFWKNITGSYSCITVVIKELRP